MNKKLAAGIGLGLLALTGAGLAAAPAAAGAAGAGGAAAGGAGAAAGTGAALGTTAAGLGAAETGAALGTAVPGLAATGTEAATAAAADAALGGTGVEAATTGGEIAAASTPAASETTAAVAASPAETLPESQAATYAAGEGQGVDATGEQILDLEPRAPNGIEGGDLGASQHTEDLGYKPEPKSSLDLSSLVSPDNLAKGAARQGTSMAVQKAVTPKTTVTMPGQQIQAPNKSSDDLWAWLNSNGKKGALT